MSWKYVQSTKYLQARYYCQNLGYFKKYLHPQKCWIGKIGC